MLPFRELRKIKPTLKYGRIFGCIGFVHNSNPVSELSARGHLRIYTGNDDYGKYRILLCDDRRIFESVHVRFDEIVFPAHDWESDDDVEENDEEITYTLFGI